MYSLLTLSLAWGATAFSVQRSDTCPFTLTSSGGQVGSLDDGQARVGGGLPPTTFSISAGTVVDSMGFGCYITPEADQFQCDENRAPASGFSISSSGAFEYQGSPTFYACAASATEYNIYTQPVAGQLKCYEMTLTASSCYSSPVSGSPTGYPSGYQPSPSANGTWVPASSIAATSPSIVVVPTESAPASSAASNVVSSVAPSVAPSVASLLASSIEVPSESAPVATASGNSPVGSPVSSVSYVQSATSPVAVPSSATVIAPTQSASTASGYSPVGSSVSSEHVVTVTIYDCAASSSSYFAATPSTTFATSVIVSSVETSPVVVPTGGAGPSAASSSSYIVPSNSATIETSPIVISTTVAGSTTAVVPSSVAISSVSSAGSSPSPSTSSVVPSSVVVSSAPTTVVTTVQISQVSSVVTSLASTFVGSSTGPYPTTMATSTQTFPQSAPYSNGTTTYTSVVVSGTAVSVSSNSPVSSSPASSPVVPSSTTSSASVCATTLSGSPSPNDNYQYPHLIVPISSSSPDTAYGTQLFGSVNSTFSTIFNFDIPASYEGKTCSLIFLLPEQADLETSAYTYSGSGSIDFAQLVGPATSATDYNNAPLVGKDLGSFNIAEGSSTVIYSAQCAAGETVSFELSAEGVELYYFQDWNPSPLGLYITYC